MAAVKRTLPTEERAPEPVSAPLPQPEPAPVQAATRVTFSADGVSIAAPKITVQGAPTPPPAPPAHPKATYQVWPHGTLQHNGKTYAPGDTLVMFVAEAERVPCLVKVDG